MDKKYWPAVVLPLIAFSILLIWVPHLYPTGRGYTFIAAALLIAAEIALVGYLINKQLAGVFIDNRNRLSLSKLQAGAWTVVVLAAFATAAAYNAAAPHLAYDTVDALKIVIPGELLLAMGISATSLVATPGLLSLKASETPDGKEVDAAAARMQPNAQAPALPPPNGKVLIMNSPADASLADLFTGDEVGNAGVADLGKIQQVLISLVLIGAYAVYVFQYFSTSLTIIPTLPVLDQSFVWLLGISHASYLAYKAAPHTQSAT